MKYEQEFPTTAGDARSRLPQPVFGSMYGRITISLGQKKAALLFIYACRPDPRGGVTQTTYDASGNVLTFTDAAGHATTFTRNAQGRPTHVEDPMGRTIDCIYDAQGNLTESIDNAGSHTFMGRDSSGRLTTYTDATGYVTQFEYSGPSAREPSKITNPDGTPRPAFTSLKAMPKQ